MAQIVPFKQIPLRLFLDHLIGCTIETGLQGVLIVSFEMNGGPKRNRLHLGRMTLVGSDLHGRFAIQGEASVQERLPNFADKHRSTLRSLFVPRSENEKALNRVHFSEDGCRSNLRYLRFTYQGQSQQIWNEGFSICCTSAQNLAAIYVPALMSEQYPANENAEYDYPPVS